MKTTIAIQTPNGYLAVAATLETVADFTVAVHKSPSNHAKGWCWAVTDPGTGLAFARSNISRQAAVDLAGERITKAGPDAVRQKLATTPKAPPVDGLPEWIAQIPEKTTRPDLDHIVSLVDRVVPLDDNEKVAVKRALSSRSGRLKAKAPSAFGDEDEQLAAAAWQGLQPNGYKIGIISVISLRGPAAELYAKLSKVRWPSAFDKDRAALEKAGVW